MEVGLFFLIYAQRKPHSRDILVSILRSSIFVL